MTPTRERRRPAAVVGRWPTLQPRAEWRLAFEEVPS
jgi:hypothetical protein